MPTPRSDFGIYGVEAKAQGRRSLEGREASRSSALGVGNPFAVDGGGEKNKKVSRTDSYWLLVLFVRCFYSALRMFITLRSLLSSKTFVAAPYLTPFLT